MASPPTPGYAHQPQGSAPQPQGYPAQGYAPQPQGYTPQGYAPQGYAPQTAVQPVVVQPQTVVILQPARNRFTPSQPFEATCPACGFVGITNMELHSGLCVWLGCLGLFCVGLWPCCWIPFCVDGFKDATHFCGLCGAYIGEQRALDL